MRLDLTGIKFNKLRVLSLDSIRTTPGGSKRAYWQCRCECGNLTAVNTSNLKVGNVISCGCAKRKSGSAFRQLLLNYKIGAKNRRVVFSISKKRFKFLTSSVCFYCGIEPKQICKTKYKKGDPEVYLYNGLDRVDNEKGYTVLNSVPCCKRCNNAKKTLSQGDFLTMVAKIFKFRIQRNEN